MQVLEFDFLPSIGLLCTTANFRALPQFVKVCIRLCKNFCIYEEYAIFTVSNNICIFSQNYQQFVPDAQITF